MRKKVTLLVFVLLAVGLLLSGCEGVETLPSDSSQSEEVQTFQKWNTDIPFKLLKDTSTEVDVIINCKLDTDQEAIRKTVSAYIDPEEAEAVFEGSDIRWVKCVADVSLPEDSEYSVLDFAFMCYWGKYPDLIFGSEYFNFNREEDGFSESSSVVIAFKQAKDFRSCKAIVYACIPADDDSYMIEIVRHVGGSHDTTVPELPDDSVLCWKISDAIME